jgi:hypothetical protein
MTRALYFNDLSQSDNMGIFPLVVLLFTVILAKNGKDPDFIRRILSSQCTLILIRYFYLICSGSFTSNTTLKVGPIFLGAFL